MGICGKKVLPMFEVCGHGEVPYTHRTGFMPTINKLRFIGYCSNTVGLEILE